jgi:hypothetical protein
MSLPLPPSPPSQQLRDVSANEGLATIVPEDSGSYALKRKNPPANLKSKAPPFFIKHDSFALSLLVFFMIVVFSFLLALFFRGFPERVNRYFLGIFKRPLPAKPELYYDVNCINDMNLTDFMNTNQLERCRTIRNIDRPGPPRRF